MIFYDKILMQGFGSITTKSVLKSYTCRFMHSKNGPKIAYTKKRGVSDVIAVLLLMGITVAGAVLISSFFSNSGLLQAQNSAASQSASIRIVGYDTRDGEDLSDIPDFNNFLDLTPRLCTKSCDGSPDNTPIAGGTEFIILTVRNIGSESVNVQSVEVNNVEHKWDKNTGGNDLTLTTPPPSYPVAGKFSIIPTTGSITQKPLNNLDSNDEFRLIIKLNEMIDPDIGLNEPIKVRVFTDKIDSPAVIITSGGVR